MTRPSMRQTLMACAHAMALRGTCSRLNVGAVLTLDTRIIASGYNGAYTGDPHCYHLDDSPCRVAVHAEENLIRFTEEQNIVVYGTTLYVTHSPCLKCAQRLVDSGVGAVVYDELYRDPAGLEHLENNGIRVSQALAP